MEVKYDDVRDMAKHVGETVLDNEITFTRYRNINGRIFHDAIYGKKSEMGLEFLNYIFDKINNDVNNLT
jgi:hypothetical protein